MEGTVQCLSLGWNAPLYKIGDGLDHVTYISQGNITGLDPTEALNVLAKLGLALGPQVVPALFSLCPPNEDLESTLETFWRPGMYDLAELSPKQLSHSSPSDPGPL